MFILYKVSPMCVFLPKTVVEERHGAFEWVKCVCSNNCAFMCLKTAILIRRGVGAMRRMFVDYLGRERST